MPIPKQLTAWMTLVNQVKRDNPTMSYKQCLQKAKTMYKK